MGAGNIEALVKLHCRRRRYAYISINVKFLTEEHAITACVPNLALIGDRVKDCSGIGAPEIKKVGYG